MKREINAYLKEWKHSERRKPLILMGARQVGKTYVLKALGNVEYEYFVYLNFEDKPSLRSLFGGSLDPAEIIKVLSIETGIPILPEKTLIVFDEVQECPEALNSLKYFNEKANEYHVIAAGSLLGVKLIHAKGFPVGKVNFLHLYPLSFFEFLQAIGEVALQSYLEELNTVEPIPTLLHEKLLRYFKIYLYTGGMPEAVAHYVHSENFLQVREVHQEILKAYSLDFAKHAPPAIIMKINQVWNSLPAQLAKENKKFIYSVIREGARAKEFETAIQWLSEASLIYKVYNITTPKLPLEGYAKFDFFKMYLLDVGLLGAMVHLSEKAIIDSDQLFQEFRGSFVENYVAQELARCHERLYYWTSEGKAELDFIFQSGNAIYPLEIKTGNSSQKKSLRVYAEKYQAKLLIRSSPMNLKKDGNILNCPLYLIGQIERLLERVDKITR